MLTFSALRVLTVAALAAGCASVDTTTLKSAPARGSVCSLDTYANESRVRRSYERLCVLEVEESNWRRGDAVEAAKPRACACGADAIVVDAVSTKTGPARATLIGIRYTDSPAR